LLEDLFLDEFCEPLRKHWTQQAFGGCNHIANADLLAADGNPLLLLIVRNLSSTFNNDGMERYPSSNHVREYALKK
jgi:hypothetical protein